MTRKGIVTYGNHATYTFMVMTGGWFVAFYAIVLPTLQSLYNDMVEVIQLYMFIYQLIPLGPHP